MKLYRVNMIFLSSLFAVFPALITIVRTVFFALNWFHIPTFFSLQFAGCLSQDFNNKRLLFQFGSEINFSSFAEARILLSGSDRSNIYHNFKDITFLNLRIMFFVKKKLKLMLVCHVKTLAVSVLKQYQHFKSYFSQIHLVFHINIILNSFWNSFRANRPSEVTKTFTRHKKIHLFSTLWSEYGHFITTFRHKVEFLAFKFAFSTLFLTITHLKLTVLLQCNDTSLDLLQFWRKFTCLTPKYLY